VIAAILRAQFLSMRWGTHRGAGLSLFTAFVWYGFWCAAAFALALVCGGATIDQLQSGVPVALLLVCLYWQVVPVISAGMGAGLDMRKLMVYPAPHAKLFLIEILLRVTTGAEMVLILAGGFAGLLRNQAVVSKTGLPAGLFRILIALLFYAAFNVLLASGLRSLLERLLSRRRVREIVVLLLVFGTALPRMLFVLRVRPRSFGAFQALTHVAALPWTAGAQIILGQELAVSLLVLVAWTLAAGLFGRAQFERSLRFDANAAQATPAGNRTRAEAWIERFYRLPSQVLADPLAALVEKELRSLARTPRFRMVFVMGFAFGLMVWLPLVLGVRAERSVSLVAQNFLAVVSVYALTLLGQVTYWNCFGFDRSAVQVYFVAPPPIRLTLVGKNIASLIFVYIEVLILGALTQALPLGIGPGKVFETLLVVGICSLYMLAFGNISSVEFPYGLKPERVSRGGASSRFQALVFILYPLALLPVFLAYLARYALASQIAFGAVLAFAAVLGSVVYWIALDSAVGTAGRHRERILRELSGGEGPVAAD
jgi:ABC-2 type transport system permease protein